jgi:hypothetical protein
VDAVLVERLNDLRRIALSDDPASSSYAPRAL